jgi:hypothetical protein
MPASATVRIGGRFGSLLLVSAVAYGCARGDLGAQSAAGTLEGSPSSDATSSASPRSDDASNDTAQTPVDEAVDESLDDGPLPEANGDVDQENATDAGLDSGPEVSTGDGRLDGSASGDEQSDTGGDAAMDAAVHDSGLDASPCINDLSNIGTADFQITLSMMSTQTGRTALVNQRRICNFGDFWDVRFNAGALEIETDTNSQSNWLFFRTNGAKVNDGRAHTVLIQRKAQTLTAYIDGIASGSGTSVASFGQLPPTAIGVDACDGNTDQTVALSGGKVTNLCITSP